MYNRVTETAGTFNSFMNDAATLDARFRVTRGVALVRPPQLKAMRANTGTPHADVEGYLNAEVRCKAKTREPQAPTPDGMRRFVDAVCGRSIDDTDSGEELVDASKPIFAIAVTNCLRQICPNGQTGTHRTARRTRARHCMFPHAVLTE